MSYVAIVCAIGFAALAVFPGIDLSIPMRIISGIMVFVALGVFVERCQGIFSGRKV